MPIRPVLPMEPDPGAVEVAPGTWLHWGLYLRGSKDRSLLAEFESLRWNASFEGHDSSLGHWLWQHRVELSEAINDAANAKELQALFDLRWKADMRAIERWQAAHPGNDNVWPDHADMVVWLMEQLDTIRALIRETLPYLETAAARSSDLERNRVPKEIADDIRKWLG